MPWSCCGSPLPQLRQRVIVQLRHRAREPPASERAHEHRAALRVRAHAHVVPLVLAAAATHVGATAGDKFERHPVVGDEPASAGRWSVAQKESHGRCRLGELAQVLYWFGVEGHVKSIHDRHRIEGSKAIDIAAF